MRRRGRDQDRLNTREIARQSNVGQRNLQTNLTLIRDNTEKSKQLDPWRSCIHNAYQLFLEARIRGYEGCLTQVNLLIRPWRTESHNRMVRSVLWKDLYRFLVDRDFW